MFLIGAKHEGLAPSGYGYRVTRLDDGRWQCQMKFFADLCDEHLLVRVIIGKIKHHIRFREVILQVSVDYEQPEWNPMRWVQKVLTVLKEDKRACSLGTHTSKWWASAEITRHYCLGHVAEGRLQAISLQRGRLRPTYDLIRGTEIHP